MTNGGDAAEQVVRLSLEGFEVAAKLSGAAAKKYCRSFSLCSQTGTENKRQGSTYQYD